MTVAVSMMMEDRSWPLWAIAIDFDCNSNFRTIIASVWRSNQLKNSLKPALVPPKPWKSKRIITAQKWESYSFYYWRWFLKKFLYQNKSQIVVVKQIGRISPMSGLRNKLPKGVLFTRALCIAKYSFSLFLS